MVNIISKLQSIGFTKNESLIYYNLLKYPNISASELAKKLSMDRTLIYQLLNKLIDKKVVSYNFKDNKKYFFVNDINNLYEPLREKQETIKEIIPKLKDLEKESKDNINQEVIVYQGKSGLEKYLQKMISSKEVCIIGGVSETFKDCSFDIQSIQNLVKSKTKGLKQVTVKSIVSKKSCIPSFLSNLDFETRILESINNLNVTAIYKNQIAIHIFTKEPIIIFIKNKNLAQRYKTYFNKLWKISKK